MKGDVVPETKHMKGRGETSQPQTPLKAMAAFLFMCLPGTSRNQIMVVSALFLLVVPSISLHLSPSSLFTAWLNASMRLLHLSPRSVQCFKEWSALGAGWSGRDPGRHVSHFISFVSQVCSLLMSPSVCSFVSQAGWGRVHWLACLATSFHARCM